MAMIPLKDSVTLTPPGTTDAWGNTTGGTPVSYNCRIKEGTKLVRDQNGNEVVSNTQILLDGKVAVDYDYDITFTDITGAEVTRNPISISTTKDIASKVIFTKVNI